MEAIFASKLYKASTHKSQIQAALADPNNQELVMQLKKYLTPETLQKLQPQESTEPISHSTSSHSDVPDDIAHNESRPSASSTPPSAPRPRHELSQMLEDAETSDSSGGPETPMDAEAEEHEGEMEEVVEEATDIDVIDYVNDTEELLKSDKDTEDVRQVKLNDDELWVYYKDKTNLNKVMDSVIDKLSDAFGTAITFSRLARTDNAIVFDIS